MQATAGALVVQVAEVDIQDCSACHVQLHMQMCVCCPAGHTVCKPCFEGLIDQVAAQPDRLQRGAQIVCPLDHCHQVYSQEIVSANATSAIAIDFLQLVEELERATARAAASAANTAAAAAAAALAIQQRRERERLEAAQALPLGWTFGTGSPWTYYTPYEKHGPILVEVAQADPVFQQCQQFFQQAGMAVPLTRVERVQNPILWTKYRKAVEAMEHLGLDKNEKWLFHGTGATDPIGIASQTGIDFRYSNPGLFGKGAYFAERSDYSNQDEYIHTNAQSERQMFLAQVAAGRIQELDQDQRDRDIVHPVQGCDSIRGHVLDPDYYAVVVYDVSQSYPTYLLTY